MKDETIEKIAALPGVGKAKAEALYEAGYTTIDKLKAATKADLQEVPGIGPKIAAAIVSGVAELGAAPAPAGEVKVVERRAAEEKPRAAKAEEKAEDVEIVERAKHAPRIKPEASEELRHAMWLKRMSADARPVFKRGTGWQKIQLEDVWRTARGMHNSQREGLKYRPKQPRVGYRTPRIARDLHPSGFREVLVHNVDDLAAIDPKTEAARIGRTVGGKKRELIVKAAGDRGIRVLNPGRKAQ